MTDVSGYNNINNITTFINNSQNNISCISSNPRRLCFWEGEEYDCSVETKHLSVPPGKIFNISVIGIGTLDLPVPTGPLYFHSYNEDTTICKTFYNINTYKEYNYNIGLSFYSTTSNSLLLRIHPAKSWNWIGLSIIISVGNCPFGFYQLTNNCTCEKNIVKLFNNTIICDINTGLIKRPNNDWIKPLIDNSTYIGFKWIPNCPEILCKNENYREPT